MAGDLAIARQGRESKRSVKAGDIAELVNLLAELKRKAQTRIGESYPIITIEEAGLDVSAKPIPLLQS